MTSSDPYFKFIPTQMDKNKTVAGLLDFKDWIYVLVKVSNVDEGIVSRSCEIQIYNKYNRYPFETPISVISGVPDVAEYEPTDLTVDDEGNLYIASSGQISKYVQRYDYAHVERAPGTMKTTLTFREFYPGVDL